MTLKSSSLFPGQGGQGAGGEGFGSEATIFLEGVGLSGEEEIFAAAGGTGVELQNAGDKFVGNASEF